MYSVICSFSTAGEYVAPRILRDFPSLDWQLSPGAWIPVHGMSIEATLACLVSAHTWLSLQVAEPQHYPLQQRKDCQQFSSFISHRQVDPFFMSGSSF